MIDLNVLPEKVREELIDYYLFLVERYGKKNDSKNSTDDELFDQYSLDMQDFNFE